MSDIVYLDVCCFKRPTRRRRRVRVRREAEAVAAVLDAVADGRVRLVRSPAHDVENERNPREDHRAATRLWLEAATIEASPGPESANRARALVRLGVTPLDALHLAFAEQANAACFATPDDALLTRARSYQQELHVEVVGPEGVPLPTHGSGT